MNNTKFAVALGRSAEAKQWKNRTYTWAAFVDKLRHPHTTHETYAEYMAMGKAEQGKIKDVGGYVAGYLNGGRRKIENVMCRSMLTLDLDYAPHQLADLLALDLTHAWALHSTHKHSANTPRFRLIVPLSREVTPEEYIATARRFAEWVNIEYFDPTTFDVNRLMFWPSASSDGEYIFAEGDGDALDVDAVLGSYRNWQDVSEWAFSEKASQHVSALKGVKQQDPTTKGGVVGAFCNAYNIHEAIAEFLPEVYEAADISDRYTYANGSTVCGVVTYDDLFAFSNHATDPASEKLCNAFDLVRVHRFGELDGDDTSGAKSFKAMTSWCRSLPGVRRVLAQSLIKDFAPFTDAAPDFEVGHEAEPAPRSERRREPKAVSRSKERPGAATAPAQADDSDDGWVSLLEIGQKGDYEPNAHNVTLILRNDPDVSGRLRLNTFSGKKFTTSAFPWPVSAGVYPRPLQDVDFAGFRTYISMRYGFKAPQIIDDVVALELSRNSYHPVRDYLDSLTWDGVPRIDTLLQRCFGCRDNIYTREVSRKWLVACVARVMNPGCKFDSVLTLVGEEGTCKSTFFAKLGGEWFTDSLQGVGDTKAFEQLQGKWVVELAELSALSKSESEAVKHFLTKQCDSYRPAYGREVVDYHRQCVFVASSNNRTFLRDQDGNRRFWPMDVMNRRGTAGELNPMGSEFAAMIPQIWAEAAALYALDEPLILSPRAEEIAEIERRNHVELDERRGMIERYLATPLPLGWATMGVEQRADFLENVEAYTKGNKAELQPRTMVCTAEIWCECFGKRREDLTQRTTREINNIMKSIGGWQYRTDGRKFEPYGKQRYYLREAAHGQE